MKQNTETMTPAQAQLWLAEREKEQPCPDIHRRRINSAGDWVEDSQFCHTCDSEQRSR